MSSMLDTAVSPQLMAELEQTYEFADSDTVRAFILSHPIIAPFLGEAHRHITSTFGALTQTVLDVVRDPEEDGEGSLYAFVQTADDADVALDRLDRFNDGWWRTASGQVAVPLHFALEYV